MPELPEVETTKRGIMPHILHQRVERVVVRQFQLRSPIHPNLAQILAGQTVRDVRRRAKYILIQFDSGVLLVHLGMSGSLRVSHPDIPFKKHDHVDLLFETGASLRYHDPRRFGCLVWVEGDPLEHPLLKDLGPEPLEQEFSGAYLHQAARGRNAAVKTFIMDSGVVVGVGNIYANEALFRARIHPQVSAGRIGRLRYDRLVETLRTVLQESIIQGGTTLRDFVNEAGKPGYFQQTLRVYGRENLPCVQCGGLIRVVRIGQRSTFFCPKCQK